MNFEYLQRTLKEFNASTTFVTRLAFFGSLIFGTLLVRRLTDQLIRKLYKYPPGHNGIPLLGSLVSLSDVNYFDYLRRNYGSVVMIQCGFKWMVVINDLKLCKNLFLKNDEFNYHRFQFGTDKDAQNISMINGEALKYRRQLFRTSFTAVLNNNTLNEYTQIVWDNVLNDELSGLSSGVHINTTQSDRVMNALKYSVFSIIFYTIFGGGINREYVKLPNMDSKDYKIFVENIDRYMEDVQTGMLLTLTGTSILALNIVKNKINKASDDIYSSIQEWYESFASNFDIAQATTSLRKEKDTTMAVMLEQVETGQLTKKQVIADIGAMFIAGIDTTTQALHNCIEALSFNTNLDTLLYNEICNNNNNNNGGDRINVLKCNQLRAFIYEVLRLKGGNSEGAIQGAPRSIINDNVKILDYNIPNGAIVIANYQSFATHKMYDWQPNENDNRNNSNSNNDYVDEININNFLNQTTDQFEIKDAFPRFGFGQRECPGKFLAKRELLLFMATILKHFKFSRNDNFELKVVAR